ncbi:MAG: hypothetical protein AVDCRST_MAG10-2714, partial [uncultured Acidimicrobiales bacterium]
CARHSLLPQSPRSSPSVWAARLQSPRPPAAPAAPPPLSRTTTTAVVGAWPAFSASPVLPGWLAATGVTAPTTPAPARPPTT